MIKNELVESKFNVRQETENKWKGQRKVNSARRKREIK